MNDLPGKSFGEPEISGVVLRPPNGLELSRHVPSRADQTDNQTYEARGASAPGQRTARGRLLRRVRLCLLEPPREAALTTKMPRRARKTSFCAVAAGESVPGRSRSTAGANSRAGVAASAQDVGYAVAAAQSAVREI